jgi:Zn-dependent M28 family amino/carboxypeptidase
MFDSCRHMPTKNNHQPTQKEQKATRRHTAQRVCSALLVCSAHFSALLVCLPIPLLAIAGLAACTGQHLANPPGRAGESSTRVAGPVPSPAAPTRTPALEFDGHSAYRHALAQCAIGPRPAGTEGNRQTAGYISTQLKQFGWQVTTQEFEFRGVPIQNVIGQRGQGPLVILGAHFDSRKFADNDPNDRTAPVPAGNDGASGVAVLLELACIWSQVELQRTIWLAFFDAEDNGGIDGWPWSVGAAYTANTLTEKPEFVIIVDMIGDADQQIYMERNSDPELQPAIWKVAADLGYQHQFIPHYKWAMTDDHTPFLQRGFRAVDLIDFDYPYWHTTQDTCDKVSPDSLERVGRVLDHFLSDHLPGSSELPGR